MIFVRIDSRELRVALSGLERRLSDMRGGMRLVGAEAVRMQERHIQTGRDSHGMRFPPLKPVTVALKGSSKPLVNTGTMKGAQTGGGKGTSITYTELGPRSVVVFVRKEQETKALTHQKGRVITPKRARILAREISGRELTRMAKTARAKRLKGINVSRSKKTGKTYVVFGRRVKVPRRQFFYATDGERRKLADVLAAWVMAQKGVAA